MEGHERAKLRLPAKATAYHIATSVIIKAIGILSTPIFTRLLSESEYGSYSFFVAVLGIASSISSAVYSGGILYGAFGSLSKNGVCKSAFSLSLILNAVICILSFAFLAKQPLLILLLFLQLCCDSLIGIYSVRAKHSYDYTTSCALALFAALGSTLLSLILVEGAEAGYLGRIYGTLIASLLVAFTILPKVIFRTKISLRSPEAKYVADNAIPFIPHAFASSVITQADKLIVAYFIGSRALAKYTVAHSLGAGLLFAVGALGSVLSPWIVRKLSTHRTEAIREPVRILFILLCSATVALTAVGPELLRFLAPGDYSEAIGAVYPTAIATLPTFLCSVYSIMLVYAENSSLASRSSVIGAAANIVFCLILIPTLEYVGAAIALLLSDTVRLTAEHYYLSRSGMSNLIPLNSLLYTFCVCAVGVCASALLYNYAWARLLILVPSSAIAISALLESRKYIFESSKQ